MPRNSVIFISCLIIGLSACGQEAEVKSEQPRQQPLNYSQETLDKVEKDVNQALQKSMDRLDSALDKKQ